MVLLAVREGPVGLLPEDSFVLKQMNMGKLGEN